MRNFFAFLFLPIRLLILGIRTLYVFVSGGDHFYLRIPPKFSDSIKSYLLRKIQGEEDPPFLITLLELLSILSQDKRLRYLSLEIPRLYISNSELYSIYKELEKIRNAGVKLIGYSEEGDLKNLILLSLCDKRYSSETGEFQSILPSLDTMFFGEFVKKWNVKVDIFQSGVYKSFGEIFTRKEFSKEARSNLKSLVEDHKKELLSLIPDGSGLDPELLQRPILDAGKLKSIGFLNGLLELDQFKSFYLHENLEEFTRSWEKIVPKKDMQKEKQKFLKENKPLSKSLHEVSVLAKYKNLQFQVTGDTRPVVAVLPLKGQIIPGRPEETEPKSGIIEGYSILKTIQDLKENSHIQAVILEIDSPGGSATESEKIYKAIKNLDQTKPVYAYLADTCASGGYYIACAARKLYASPTATVGSIGTILLRFNLEGLYEKLGISKDKIGFYTYREIYSETGKLSRESVAFLKNEIRRLENLFLRRIEESRKIPAQTLDNMAGGRVFNARKFVSAGLIDGVGSLMDVARNLSEIEWKHKPLRLYYQAPRYNLKTAFKESSPFSVGFQAIQSSILSANLRELINLYEQTEGTIQYLWLGKLFQKK